MADAKRCSCGQPVIPGQLDCPHCGMPTEAKGDNIATGSENISKKPKREIELERKTNQFVESLPIRVKPQKERVVLERPGTPYRRKTETTVLASIEGIFDRVSGERKPLKIFLIALSAFWSIYFLVGFSTIAIAYILSPGILVTAIISKLFETGGVLKWLFAVGFSMIAYYILQNLEDFDRKEKNIAYLAICSIICAITTLIYLFNPGSGFEKKFMRPTVAGMFRFVNYAPVAKWVVVWPGFRVFYNVSDDATFKGKYFFKYAFNTIPPDGIDVKEVKPVRVQENPNQIALAKAAEELKQKELKRLQEAERLKRERELEKARQLAEENRRIAEENERIAAEIRKKEEEAQALNEIALAQKIRGEERKVNAFFEKGLDEAKNNFKEHIPSVKGHYFFIIEWPSSGRFSIIQAKDLVIKTMGTVPEDSTVPEPNTYNVMKKGYFYWEGNVTFSFREFRTKEIPDKFIDLKKVKKNHSFFVKSGDKLYKHINGYPWSEWQSALNRDSLELKFGFSESSGKWNVGDLSKYSLWKAGIDKEKLELE